MCVRACVFVGVWERERKQERAFVLTCMKVAATAGIEPEPPGWDTSALLYNRILL